MARSGPSTTRRLIGTRPPPRAALPQSVSEVVPRLQAGACPAAGDQPPRPCRGRFVSHQGRSSLDVHHTGRGCGHRWHAHRGARCPTERGQGSSWRGSWALVRRVVQQVTGAASDGAGQVDQRDRRHVNTRRSDAPREAQVRHSDSRRRAGQRSSSPPVCGPQSMMRRSVACGGVRIGARVTRNIGNFSRFVAERRG